mgnify:FL=1
MLQVHSPLVWVMDYGAQLQQPLKQGTLRTCKKNLRECKRWKSNRLPNIKRNNCWTEEALLPLAPSCKKAAWFLSTKWTWTRRTSRPTSILFTTLSIMEELTLRKVALSWKPKMLTWTKTLPKDNHFGPLRTKRRRSRRRHSRMIWTILRRSRTCSPNSNRENSDHRITQDKKLMNLGFKKRKQRNQNSEELLLRKCRRVSNNFQLRRKRKRRRKLKKWFPK